VRKRTTIEAIWQQQQVEPIACDILDDDIPIALIYRCNTRQHTHEEDADHFLLRACACVDQTVESRQVHDANFRGPTENGIDAILKIGQHPALRDMKHRWKLQGPRSHVVQSVPGNIGEQRVNVLPAADAERKLDDVQYFILHLFPIGMMLEQVEDDDPQHILRRQGAECFQQGQSLHFRQVEGLRWPHEGGDPQPVRRRRDGQRRLLRLLFASQQERHGWWLASQSSGVSQYGITQAGVARVQRAAAEAPCFDL